MKICSACLLGINCRYNGESKPNERIIEMSKTEMFIPVCPEQLGGLSTPRKPVEESDDKAMTNDGEDLTENFKRGAEQVLRIAKLYGIRNAIMKQGSPSCGCGKIPSGTFTEDLIIGDGFTTRLLKENGIEVLTEEDF